MQICVESKNVRIDQGVRDYIAQRLGVAIGGHRHHIKRATVHLNDENGPRGGFDKRCRIEVVVPGSADVVVTEWHSHLGAAIDRAVERVTRAIIRSIERARTLTRRGDLRDLPAIAQTPSDEHS